MQKLVSRTIAGQYAALLPTLFSSNAFFKNKSNFPNMVLAEHLPIGAFVQFKKKGINCEEGDDSMPNYGFP